MAEQDELAVGKVAHELHEAKHELSVAILRELTNVGTTIPNTPLLPEIDAFAKALLACASAVAGGKGSEHAESVVTCGQVDWESLEAEASSVFYDVKNYSLPRLVHAIVDAYKAQRPEAANVAAPLPPPCGAALGKSIDGFVARIAELEKEHWAALDSRDDHRKRAVEACTRLAAVTADCNHWRKMAESAADVRENLDATRKALEASAIETTPMAASRVVSTLRKAEATLKETVKQLEKESTVRELADVRACSAEQELARLESWRKEVEQLEHVRAFLSATAKETTLEAAARVVVELQKERAKREK